MDAKKDVHSVLLNVYDLHWTVCGLNRFLQDAANVGAFHVGIEVYGVEFMFCGLSDDDDSGGVIRHIPKHHTAHVYRETINLGVTALSHMEVARLISKLSEDWVAASYHLVTRNCIHFAEALASALQVAPVPDRILNGCEALSSLLCWVGLVTPPIRQSNNSTKADSLNSVKDASSVDSRDASVDSRDASIDNSRDASPLR